MGFNLLLHIYDMILRTSSRTGGAEVEVRSVEGTLPPSQDISECFSLLSFQSKASTWPASCTALAHKETGLANTRRNIEGTMV